MDYFNISQLCCRCGRGKKVFKIELRFYDVDGKLNLTRAQISRDFSFKCEVRHQVSNVDFYRFSNREMIV